MKYTRGRSLLALAAALVMTGCAGNALEQLGGILGSATGGGAPAATSPQQVSAEIRSINTQQQTIEVATQNGQTGSVRYDQNTVVVYKNQQYQVSALERGDVALLTVQNVQNATYVSRIDVQQSVQDRTGTTTGGSGNLIQLSGTISQINQNNGTFVLQTQNGNVTVALPYNPPAATVNYFRQLRNGNTVKVEATQVGTNRVEIYRFL